MATSDFETSDSEASDFEASDFDRLGGEAALRRIIEDFTARVFDDVMIGFLFEGKPKRRITEMEYRFAAAHLGGPVVYTGRPIAEAHARSPILGGHFMRRRKILIDTLADHGVDEDIVARWLVEVDALREAVLGVGVDATGCDHDAQAARARVGSGGRDLLKG